MLDVLGQDLRAPRCLSLRGKKWKYRGEGNANLVLALAQERKIVRLRKNENGIVSDVREEEERDRVLRETVFCRCIMVPLIGEVYIQPPLAAFMEEEEVVCLDRTLRAQRPTYRHHKGLQFSHVTIYPDYALLPLALNVVDTSSCVTYPTFCVEVKPKQGWIPWSDRRLPKCTFCLNQYLKVKVGSVQNRSQYCPLDLFSGIQTRMKNALHNLLLTPQNNLKIFKDGVLVYGDGDEDGSTLEDILENWLGNPDCPVGLKKLFENFCELVFKALTYNLCSEKNCSSGIWNDFEFENGQAISQCCASYERVPTSLIAKVNHVLPGPPCDWSAESLPQDCILERILRIQKLEQCGSDSIYQIYHSEGYNTSGSDYSYVSSLLKMNRKVHPIHRYLLATTAKDCSIMMAFQRCNLPPNKLAKVVPEKHVLMDLDTKNYIFNIGVSDLDPKPMSCIEKHRKRDCEILSACLATLENEKLP